VTTTLHARHFATGEWVRLLIEGRTISSVSSSIENRTMPAADWVAPAFWDIQTNGRWGVSFSDPSLTPGQVAEIVRAQAALGTARLCPTLITAPFDAFCQGLAAIARACEDDPDVAARVVGIHVEGPYISSLDGYRGAHPLDAVRDPDWDEFQRFQDAAAGRIILMTLAPERPGAIDFIRRAVSSGVKIALGHTTADGNTLRAAVDAGATLSTHLGNGIASTLPRHPNPIWEQAAIDGLSASFIADGHHLDPSTLRVLVRAKTPGRTILVSDASPLAGLPPGTYGPWAVHPSGKIVVSGTPYLAGSNQALEVGLNTVLKATGLSMADAIGTVTKHPARLLGFSEPAIEVDQPANLVVFRQVDDGSSPAIKLVRVCVDGEWTEARADAPSPWDGMENDR
jgi:N-acetylglucosamine-6-phosphate deacetylase